jgi:xanthine dehydrogenase YagR molybdenum-binding subunit
MGSTDKQIAPPQGRVEAWYKVTGSGKYAAEYDLPELAHAVFVTSTIPAGHITQLHLDDARQVGGVIDIISHLHRPEVAVMLDEQKFKESKFTFKLFHTDEVYFKGQPIAMVIAETPEDAAYAASLVTADYSESAFNTDFENAWAKTTLKTGKDRGNPDASPANAIVVDEVYQIPSEVHHPMEMHATIAQWTSDNKLRLWDKTQGVNMVQKTMSTLMGIPKENIEVTAEYMGGGFGSGLRVWANTLAATLGSKQTGRPVKLVLTRPQMFSLSGYRPESRQRVKLTADASGKLTGLVHQSWTGTSVYEDFGEDVTRISRLIYGAENLRTESGDVKLNLSTPTYMRAPGECSGAFGLESAMDELSYKLKLDPVALRMANISDQKHPDNGKPWSTHHLKDALKKGAEMIGWNDRKATPAQQTDGLWQVGYGMAVGMWNAGRSKASAAAVLHPDGSVTIQTAMTDIGTGTGTGMFNMAEATLGVPKDKLHIELGSSKLPPAPNQGGSTGLSSLSGAVIDACNSLQQKLAQLASGTNKTYQTADPKQIRLGKTEISIAGKEGVSYRSLFAAANGEPIRVEVTSAPGSEKETWAFATSAAHFCKVRVHRHTGKVVVDRYVCVADGGKVVNEKAAANQVIGSVAGGIGMALMEERQVDHRLGSLVGDDLASYHFAVNADVPIVEVAFVGEPDTRLNPAGLKGLGEIGIIGAAPAITNAIYNATGKRHRDLPLTPDKTV